MASVPIRYSAQESPTRIFHGAKVALLRLYPIVYYTSSHEENATGLLVNRHFLSVDAQGATITSKRK
jgi:hypothetical protein